MRDNITDHLLPVALLSLFNSIQALPYLIGGGAPEEYWGDVMGSSGYVILLSESIFKWGQVVPQWDSTGSVPLWYVASPFAYLNAFIFKGVGSIWTTVKLVQFIVAVVATLSMYCAGFALFRSRAAAVSSGIFYVGTPFFASQLAHHVFIAWGYAIFPLALVSTYWIRTKNSAVSVGFGAIATSLLVLTSPQAIFLYGLPLVLFFLFLNGETLKPLFRIRKRYVGDRPRSRRESERIWKRAMLVCGLSLATMVFFAVPYILQPFPYTPPTSRFTGSNLFAEPTVFYALTLQYGEIIPFLASQIPPLILLLETVPMILASTALLRQPGRLILTFFVLGITSLTLSLATTQPFSFLFSGLTALPYARFIRTPDRFIGFGSACFSLLAGLSVSFLIRRASIHPIKKMDER